MYNPNFVQSIMEVQIESESNSIKQKKNLIKKLAKLIMLNNFSISNKNLTFIRRKCLDLIFQNIIDSAADEYILTEVSPAEITPADGLVSPILSAFAIAKKGNVEATLEFIFDEVSLDKVQYEPSQLSQEIQNLENNISDSLLSLDYDDEVSVYHRVSIIKNILDENIDSDAFEKTDLKKLLSLLRLSLLVYDIKNREATQYYKLILLREFLIKRENNKEYQEFQEILFEANGKDFRPKYKIGGRHFDLLENFVDNWYAQIIRDICDPEISNHKELLRLIVEKQNNY